eukprot:5882631-Prorocentrum_lima.AAC.1
MTSSLVGSEMCIRDRYYGLTDNEDESWRSCLFSSPKKLLNRYLKSVVPYIKVNDETSYYLATSGKKTLGEL